MALYLIGDLQGCDSPLQRLLDRLDFSPSRDTLFLLGDLVNRGPSSLAVLRRLMGYGEAARCLLGNHDLHLLAAAHGIRPANRLDTLQGILQAPDRAALLDWVRHQRLAMRETLKGQDILMVHAGVLPDWSAAQTMALAGEVEAALRGPAIAAFLGQMYGNVPAKWDQTLQGADRLRVVVNALTRLRFCTTEGVMEFNSKEGAGTPPEGYMPWFNVPGRQTAGPQRRAVARYRLRVGRFVERVKDWGDTSSQRTYPSALRTGAATGKLSRYRSADGLEQRCHLTLGFNVGRDATNSSMLCCSLPSWRVSHYCCLVRLVKKWVA